MGSEPMTAEEMVREVFDCPTGPLEDCDRAASAEMLAYMMREHAAASVKPFREHITALNELLVCYRLGKLPSEALHRRLERSRAAIEEVRDGE